jgi:tRNA(adenine34) deaminase
MTFSAVAFMKEALMEAKKATLIDEVPVGAVVVHEGCIISRGHNLTRSTCDPTAHGEVVALRRAAEVLKTPILENCDVYVTLEPCAMCGGALSLARIRHVYFGAFDPKGGALDHGPRLYEQPTCLHRPQVWGGIEENQCQKALKEFFIKKRTCL